MLGSLNFSGIRQLASAGAAGRVALAEFQRTVSVWDLDVTRHVATFPTILDFGGKRLGLSNDGETLLCAAYHREGVAAYHAASGGLLWQRRDVKRPQRISTSRSRRVAYVGFSDGPCLVLSLDEGTVTQRLRGVRQVTESPFAPLVFIDQRRPVVARQDLEPILTVPRTTFAFLDVAFGPDHLAITEAGGPVTCIDLVAQKTAWIFTPAQGVHCLCLAYCSQLQAFAGVLWSYEKGGPKELVVFEAGGSTSVIRVLGEAPEHCFCQGGSSLLTAAGTIVHVASGRESALQGALALER